MSPHSLESLLPLFYGLLAGGALALILVFRRTRQSKAAELELSPNCLLTKYPVMLVTGTKTLKNTLTDQQNSYEMLKQHGYATEWTQIPVEYQSKSSLERQLLELLNELHQEHLRFHFMVTTELFPLFKEVLAAHSKFLDTEPSTVVSLTLLHYPESRTILKRAVELSEQDFIDSQKI